MELSIVIPVYNEQKRIEPTLRTLYSFLQDSNKTFEIIVVDDGSNDATMSIVEMCCKDIPELRVLHEPKNNGKGYAVKKGMLEAKGRFRMFYDADGSIPPSEIPKILAPLLAKESEISIGSRYVENSVLEIQQPYWRKLWSRFVYRWFEKKWVSGIMDVHCGCKAMTAKATHLLFEVSEIKGWSFDLELLCAARLFGLRVSEVGICWKDDSQSKVNFLRDIWRSLREYRLLLKNIQENVYQERHLLAHSKTSNRKVLSLDPISSKQVHSKTQDALLIAGKMISNVSFQKYHPVLVNLVVTRQCNLRCGYCVEYSPTAPAVPLEILKQRMDCLQNLGTLFINLNGGEPLLHPQILELVTYVREKGMFPVMNTNGYLLTKKLILGLNQAGLHTIQISLDNLKPNEITQKSLQKIHKQLYLLKKWAQFSVRVNTVLGSGNPEEAVEIARWVTSMGFEAKCSLVRTGLGAVKELDERTLQAFREIQALKNHSPFYLNENYNETLIRDGKRDWKCRSGARYFSVCEDGLVHFCESSYGDPGIPLQEYGLAEIKKFYHMKKSCSPSCAVAYAHQISRLDSFRSQNQGTIEVQKKGWMHVNNPKAIEEREALLQIMPYAERSKKTLGEI